MNILQKLRELAYDLDQDQQARQMLELLDDLERQIEMDKEALKATFSTAQWPSSRDVGRFGDMDPIEHLRVGLDSDNDVYVSVWGPDGGASVEFCNPGGGGGGSSRKTRQALIALMVAMEEDNKDRPDKDWWAKRGGSPK